jgi:predicted house-cleaning noncanonical NTP pyrophosphatase (MazG superfamily)
VPDGYPIKLVRDRVQDIDTSEGIAYRPVSGPEEHLELLKIKLGEEVAEYLVSGRLTELVDVFEAVRCLSNVGHDYTLSELEKAALGKHDERGGFDRGTVMVTVEPGETDAPSARERELEKALRDVRFHTGIGESKDGTINEIRETVDRALGEEAPHG